MDDIVIPQSLLWLVIGIGVLVQFLREFAAVEAYKRFIPYLCIGLGAAGVKLFGGLPLADCVQLGVAIGLMSAGGYDALNAFKLRQPPASGLPPVPASDVPAMPSVTTPLIALCAALLLLAGCAASLFNPALKARLNQTSLVVDEFDRRCQAGDDAACREGLARAAQTLQILATEGGEQ